MCNKICLNRAKAEVEMIMWYSLWTPLQIYYIQCSASWMPNYKRRNVELSFRLTPMKYERLSCQRKVESVAFCFSNIIVLPTCLQDWPLKFRFCRKFGNLGSKEITTKWNGSSCKHNSIADSQKNFRSFGRKWSNFENSRD